MIKSKQFKYIKLNNGNYALFNNLLLDLVFVEEKVFLKLQESKFDELPEELIAEFCNKGILIGNENVDNKAIENLRNNYLKTTKKIDTLYLIIAQGCNLGCKYCFAENENGNWENRLMTFDTAKIAIDKFAEHAIKNEVEEPTVMLFGGEPLLNWKLIKEIVEYANSNYKDILSFSIVTNGTLINESKIEFFKENNIIPAISLDGPKLINDENRVFKNSDKSVYDYVLKAIKLMQEKDCKFGLSVTLTPAVIKDRKEFVNWIKELGINDVYLNPLHCDYEKGWEEHYKKNTKLLIETFYDLLETNIINSRILRQINSFMTRSFYFADCCAGGLNQLTIKPSGDVMVCQCNYFLDKNKMGNIITDDIEKIINNKNSEYWVNNVPIMKDKCLDCEGLFICGGSCVTSDTNLFGTNNVVDESYCIYIKTFLEWIVNQLYLERGDKNE